MADADTRKSEDISKEKHGATRVTLVSYSSIGDADDLLQEPTDAGENSDESKTNKTQLSLLSCFSTNESNKFKLGWNLPTNDLSKSGKLDTISVDSYWVNEQEIEDIAAEKARDPCNPNYKAVYGKMMASKTSADPSKKDPI